MIRSATALVFYATIVQICIHICTATIRKGAKLSKLVLERINDRNMKSGSKNMGRRTGEALGNPGSPTLKGPLQRNKLRRTRERTRQ